METKSPWSTPTESDIVAAEESALIQEKEAALFVEIDYKLNKSFVRELGDGEPSLENNDETRRNNIMDGDANNDVPPSPTKRNELDHYF